MCVEEKKKRSGRRRWSREWRKRKISTQGEVLRSSARKSANHVGDAGGLMHMAVALGAAGLLVLVAFDTCKRVSNLTSFRSVLCTGRAAPRASIA